MVYSPDKSIIQLITIENVYEITKSDDDDLTFNTIAIYVGVTGNLRILDINGNEIILKNLASGLWHPIRAKKVFSTNTTVTDIVGAY
jgi:hypothetical protein